MAVTSRSGLGEGEVVFTPIFHGGRVKGGQLFLTINEEVLDEKDHGVTRCRYMSGRVQRSLLCHGTMR